MRAGEVVRRAGPLVAAGALAAWALAHRDLFAPSALEARVAAAGALGPAAFVALYALATVACLPGSLTSLAGGALFGPLWGTLWNLTGATLGATVAFLLARQGVGPRLTDRVGGRARRVLDAVDAEGWRVVALARLVPLVPFNLLNYALGLTRVRTSHYVLATLAGMLPGAVAYTYLGYAGRQAVAGAEPAVGRALLALGAVATLALLGRLARAGRPDGEPVSRPAAASQATSRSRARRHADPSP